MILELNGKTKSRVWVSRAYGAFEGGVLGVRCLLAGVPKGKISCWFRFLDALLGFQV